MDSQSLFRGTVLGLTSRRVYVQLDDPPLEVKLYSEDFEKVCRTSFTLKDDDTRLESADKNVPDMLLGGEVGLVLESFDTGRRRYLFRLAR